MDRTLCGPRLNIPEGTFPIYSDDSNEDSHLLGAYDQRGIHLYHKQSRTHHFKPISRFWPHLAGMDTLLRSGAQQANLPLTAFARAFIDSFAPLFQLFLLAKQQAEARNAGETPQQIIEQLLAVLQAPHTRAR